jgi:hypothetical protein
MRTEDKPLEDDRSEIEREEDRVEARRRLLKAGLVAVPFLVTLYALPARAGGGGQGSLGFYGSGGGGDGTRPRGGGSRGGGGGHRTDSGGDKRN